MTKTQYILDPETNTVRRWEISETVANMEEFITNLASDQEINTPVLHKDCAHYRRSADGAEYTIYKPGGILKVGASGLVGDLNVLMSDLEIVVPPRVYVFKGSGGIATRACRFVFSGAETRYQAKVAPVYQPWLPNMYHSIGAFCGGATFEDICNEGGSVEERVDKAVDYMEASIFNNDLDSYIYHIPNNIRNRWEQLGDEEIEGIDWSPEIRSAVGDGGWHGPIRCLLRLHMDSKHLLNQLGEERAVATITQDLTSNTSQVLANI
jgi:hypothetical protein